MLRYGLLLCCFTLTLSAFGAPGSDEADASARLPGHVLEALAGAQPLAAASPGDETLTLTLVLKRDDPAGFADYLAAVYDPASPRYRRFLTQTELTERFGPSRDTYDAVLGWLQANGLGLVQGSANRLTLTVAGPRTAVESAFGVSIGTFRLGEQTFFANREEPRLPAGLAPRVQAVAGLSNLARPTGQKKFVNAIVAPINCSSCATAATGSTKFDADACTSKLKDGQSYDYTVAATIGTGDVIKTCEPAFKGPLARLQGRAAAVTAGKFATAAGTPWREVDGSGQTVGLLQFDNFDPADIVDYLDLMGLPPSLIANVSSVAVNGGATRGDDEAEVLMDTVSVMVLAPGARIVIYNAPFTGAGTSFQALFNAMLNDGVDIISNSWAYCENQTTLADVQSIDALFQAAAASGISVFNASGDSGSTCLNGSPNTVAVPAGSPNATAVGGSSLTQGPGWTYGTETWWNGSGATPPSGQGGFGVSRFFARPAYQSGFTASAMRSVPDVVANADPAEGIILCRGSAGGCPDGFLYGGTSSAAPTWAGLTALLNQARGTNLGLLNPLLYPLAATDAFHGPTRLGSDFAHVGLGSPNLGALQLRLNGLTAGSVDAAQSGLSGWVEPKDSSTFAQLGGVPADGVTPVHMVARLRDADGHAVSGKTVRLDANPAGQVTITPATAVSSVDNGAAIFTVTTNTPQAVSFTATDVTDGAVLTPFAIDFVVPPASSAGISAAPTNVLNNGSAATTVTVTLKDALGRPTPGKLVTVSQGGGRSVISGPNPSVTGDAGTIAFTATNEFPETVTYTATNVTDGDLSVPGTATVTFAGLASLSCVTGSLPVGAPGYVLTPFATGFATRILVYGNVDFRCQGATNPTFTTDGSVYVANFAFGDMFRFGAAGGAVSSADVISNLGLTISQPTAGLDGRLYATHAATTGDFRTGNIIEIDPRTGAQLRVVAANLTCPFGLSVDPLSGDLFFDDNCGGGGSDNPSLFRVRDPGSANPTVEVYATMPSTPNGAISFAPDGTIYVVTDAFTVVNAPIIRVNGTDKPTPSPTPVPNLTTTFFVRVGATNPDGSARSLIILGPTGLEIADITTDPPTRTALTQGLMGSGVIGPDGCLYASLTNSIYRLAPTSGACEFTSTNPSPGLDLAPATTSPDPLQGNPVTLTARLRNVTDPGGLPVFFQVNGTNPQNQMVRADSAGEAAFEYAGTFTGADQVVATATPDVVPLTSNAARLNWAAGRHTSFLTLNLSPGGAVIDQPVTLIGSLTDVSAQPAVPVAGQTIAFTLDGDTCTGLTGADGTATCTLTPRLQGQLSLVAEFAGTTGLTPAAERIGFNVLAQPQTANTPPIANAGANQTARQGSTVTLDGRASQDPDQGPSALTYAWTKTSGPPATLTGAATAQPTFQAVTAGTSVFQLIVNDGAADSPASSVTIRVPLLGDVDLDGDVDADDLRLVTAVLNKPANGVNDVRDINGDRTITVLDTRKLSTLCTRSRCATR